MAKTKEELVQLKDEYKALTTKLQELSEGELNIVVGGIDFNLLREFMAIVFRPIDSTTDGHVVSE